VHIFTMTMAIEILGRFAEKLSIPLPVKDSIILRKQTMEKIFVMVRVVSKFCVRKTKLTAIFDLMYYKLGIEVGVDPTL
jgi:hypothetical protein